MKYLITLLIFLNCLYGDENYSYQEAKCKLNSDNNEVATLFLKGINDEGHLDYSSEMFEVLEKPKDVLTVYKFSSFDFKNNKEELGNNYRFVLHTGEILHSDSLVIEDGKFSLANKLRLRFSLDPKDIKLVQKLDKGVGGINVVNALSRTTWDHTNDNYKLSSFTITNKDYNSNNRYVRDSYFRGKQGSNNLFKDVKQLSFKVKFEGSFSFGFNFSHDRFGGGQQSSFITVTKDGANNKKIDLTSGEVLVEVSFKEDKTAVVSCNGVQVSTSKIGNTPSLLFKIKEKNGKITVSDYSHYAVPFTDKDNFAAIDKTNVSKGDTIEITEDSAIVKSANNPDVTIPLDKIDTLSFKRTKVEMPKAKFEIFFVDGSKLYVADIVKYDGKYITVKHDNFKEFKCHIKTVNFISIY